MGLNNGLGGFQGEVKKSARYTLRPLKFTPPPPLLESPYIRLWSLLIYGGENCYGKFVLNVIKNKNLEIYCFLFNV